MEKIQHHILKFVSFHLNFDDSSIDVQHLVFNLHQLAHVNPRSPWFHRHP